jgi:hypothetical protein
MLVHDRSKREAGVAGVANPGRATARTEVPGAGN